MITSSQRTDYSDPASARSRIPLLSKLRRKLSSINFSGFTFPAFGLETASIRLMLLRPATDGNGFRFMLALQYLESLFEGCRIFLLEIGSHYFQHRRLILRTVDKTLAVQQRLSRSFLSWLCFRAKIETKQPPRLRQTGFWLVQGRRSR